MSLSPGWRIAGRVLAATAGAYIVTAGSAALLAVLLVASTRIGRSDALIVGSMAGYVLFTFLMLWCFAERRLLRVWAVLLSATMVTHGMAMWIEPALLVTSPAP